MIKFTVGLKKSIDRTLEHYNRRTFLKIILWNLYKIRVCIGELHFFILLCVIGKGNCIMANGKTAIGCHEVDESCDGGCSMSNSRYKCEPKNGKSSGISYVLWDCGPTIRNDKCVGHFYSETNYCDICCINKNCGSGMPKCLS